LCTTLSHLYLFFLRKTLKCGYLVKWWWMEIVTIVKGIIGFLILDLYFYSTAKLANPIFAFAGLLLFFPIASFVSKWAGLGGLKGIGLFFHKGLGKNFFYSFLIGFLFWMLMFSLEFLSGDLQFAGFRKPLEMLVSFVMITAGFFVGSLINDLIIRGYLMNLFKGRMRIGLVFAISILIYSLDDIWNAGFSISNTVFSMILGLSLTLAYYKTGSIWADTGIHFGLNLAYGLLFGLAGNPATSVFVVKEIVHTSWFADFAYFFIPAFMFVFILWAIKYYNKTEVPSNRSTFSA
jgi:membrane protease YdiL (CAAX protease family)